MAHFTSALSFLLVLMFFSLVKIQARESKFFTKAVVNTTENVTQHVDPPLPASAPVEAEKMNRGYGLYGRDEIPTEEENFDNEEFSNNGLPSNYNERSYVTVPQGDDNKDEFSNNGLPSNYNEHSYVTVPQRFTDTPKFAEMDNYFNDNYNHNTYSKVKDPQGMSDTRTLENGKYHYALDGNGRQRGPGSPPKFNSEGYYGNNGQPNSEYEFDTMEEFEKQEGYSQIPGEYINP